MQFLTGLLMEEQTGNLPLEKLINVIEEATQEINELIERLRRNNSRSNILLKIVPFLILDYSMGDDYTRIRPLNEVYNQYFDKMFQRK